MWICKWTIWQSALFDITSQWDKQKSFKWGYFWQLQWIQKSMENQYLFNLQCFRVIVNHVRFEVFYDQQFCFKYLNCFKYHLWLCKKHVKTRIIFKLHKNFKLSFQGFSHDLISKFRMELLGIFNQVQIPKKWNQKLHKNAFYQLMVAIQL